MTDADRLRLRGRTKLKEDFRAAVYPDSLGYWTIGYGTLVDARKGGGITKAEAEYLLANRLRIAEQACEDMPAYLDLSPPRQAVLIEMCFILGADGLRKFTRMFSALVRQDYEHAASEILDSVMARQIKGRAVELFKQMKTGRWAVAPHPGDETPRSTAVMR